MKGEREERGGALHAGTASIEGQSSLKGQFTAFYFKNVVLNQRKALSKLAKTTYFIEITQLTQKMHFLSQFNERGFFKTHNSDISFF